MAAAAYFDQIQKIYIAFYQRPADPAGLRYWAGKVNDAGGDLSQVINAFAASSEASTLYGAIDASTIGGVIDSLYLALFNRPPEAAGRQFYIDSFAAGTFTPASIALAVLVGAQERDNAAIEHKLQVANEFTQQVDGRPLSDPTFGDGSATNASYAGSDAEAAARAILAGVTADPATVLTPEQVTSTLQTDIAQPGDPILDGNTGGGGGDTGGGGGGDTGGGGGPPPTPTFSVALDAATGALTFAGTATGAITFSVDASGNVTFTRGGTVAADTVALSAIHSAPTGTTFKLSTTAADLTVVSANTLKTASWIDFTAASYRIKDSTAHILAELNSSTTGELKPGSPLAQASAIVATDAMTAAQFTIPGLAERMAEGSVTLDLGTNGATPEQLALIVTHIDKVADGGITGTLKLAKLDSGDESGYFCALLGKAAADATVNVAAEGMTAAELITLSEYIAKVNAITFLRLTSAQSAQEIANLLSKAIGAEVDLSGMSEAQLGAVLDNASGLADGGITAITLTGAQLQVLHDANALGKLAAGSVTVSGALSDMEKALVIAQIGKIAQDGISAITLTDAEAKVAGTLASHALKASSVTIGAVTDSKALVLANLGKIATDGISAITLTKAEATTTLLDNPVLQTGSVTISDAVDGAYYTGLSAAQLAKIAEGGITAITLTPAQATAQLLASAALKDGAVTLSDAVDAAYLSDLSPAQQAKFAEGGYSLSDTLAHLQTLSAEVLTGASSYTLTDAQATLLNLTPAQIDLVQGASNATAYDVVAPAFASVSSSGNTVVLTFSEAITAGEGNIVIKSAAGSTVATIAVADATINGKSLSVTPQAALTADASYYVEVAAGAVKDAVGNDFAGIADATTAGFTATVAAFDVTKEQQLDGGYIYRVGTDHGAVEVTWTYDCTTGDVNYTFKPKQGEAKTVKIDVGGTTFLHLVVDSPLVLTGTAAALTNVQITGSGSVTVRGSDGNQELSIQTTGSNTIEAGAGTDWVMLGGGADKVVIKGGTSVTTSDSTATTYDTIMFFDLGNDTIALPTTDILQSGPYTLPNNGGSPETLKVSFGVVTEFNLYGDSGNLKNKIDAVLEVLGGNQAAVAFVHGTNTYVLYGDGEAGTQSSDIVVQLTGVVGAPVTSLGFSASPGTLVLSSPPLVG